MAEVGGRLTIGNRSRAQPAADQRALQPLAGEGGSGADGVEQPAVGQEAEVVDQRAPAEPQHAGQLVDAGLRRLPVVGAEGGDDQVDGVVGIG